MILKKLKLIMNWEIGFNNMGIIGQCEGVSILLQWRIFAGQIFCEKDVINRAQSPRWPHDPLSLNDDSLMMPFIVRIGFGWVVKLL